MKLRIDDYSFGMMTIGGKKFTSDLILYPDGRIQDNWRRSKGHSLTLDDITMVLKAAPHKLILGTGASGMMRVSENVVEFCKKHGIELKVCRTSTAVTLFNNSVQADTTVAACFHLTC